MTYLLFLFLGAFLGWTAHKSEAQRERRRSEALGKVFERIPAGARLGAPKDRILGK